MRKLGVILVIIILAGCSPTRRLARLLERHPLPEKRDTVFLPGEIVYKDTTVYEYLPGEKDTVEIYVDVPVDLPDTSIHASTSLARATAYLQANTLGLNLVQLDSLFQWKLDSAIREHTPDTIKVITETSVPVYIKPKPFWRIAAFIMGGLLLFIIGLLVLRK